MVRKLMLAICVLAVVAAGCSSSKSASSPTTSVGDTATSVPASAPTSVPAAGAGAGKVSATMSDFKLELASSSAPAGKVDFTVRNDGPSPHEFVVFKTDLAPDALPVNASANTVDEEGPGVTHVDEIEQFPSGTTKTLSLPLAAGRYVLVCNLPGHYKLGMHVPFEVS